MCDDAEGAFGAGPSTCIPSKTTQNDKCFSVYRHSAVFHPIISATPIDARG
jgi:hypothetical protein